MTAIAVPLGTLKVTYTCRACLISNVKVDVRERGAEQPMEEWVTQVLSTSVAADHRRRSPTCKNRKLDARIPETGRRVKVEEDPPPREDGRPTPFDRRRERLAAELAAGEDALREVEDARDRETATAKARAFQASEAFNAAIRAEGDAAADLTLAEIAEDSARMALQKAIDATALAGAAVSAAKLAAEGARATCADARAAVAKAGEPFAEKVAAARHRVERLRYRLSQHDARGGATPALFMGTKEGSGQ